MSEKPKWTVTKTRDDIIPNRLTVEYTLDDGTTWATHFPPTCTIEEIEETLESSWLQRSQSEKATAIRLAKGMAPKIKKEDIPKDWKDKEWRENHPEPI